jgi:hypothetical protein
MVAFIAEAYPMSYDNLSSVSQNVLKFYQQLTGEERRVPFILGRNNQYCFGYGNRWSGGYILVSCAHSNTSYKADKISKHSEKHYSSYHTT